MTLESKRITDNGNHEEAQMNLIRNHDFFQGKKIISMKYNDLEWYVNVEDKRKKYGSSLYIVHPYNIQTKRISPIEVELVYRIKWILKVKKAGVRYSWSINGQPMKNVESVYYEDNNVINKYRGR